MKRKMILPITLLLVFTLVTVASASGTILADVDVRQTGTPTVENNTRLTVGSSYVSACNPSYTIYLKWNVSDVTTAAKDTSTLKLKVDIFGGASGNLALYEVSDTSWTEGTISASAPPALAANPITTVPVPTAAGQNITFTGSALADYINKQSAHVGGTDTIAGPDILSLAVRIIDCTTFDNSIAFFSSTGTTPPVLSVMNPTAVSLSTFAAAGPATNWLLIAGLGLAALAAGGAWLYRKQATR